MSNLDFIQPERLFVNQIFLQDFYSIPIYQRSYAWGKDEIEQLINDIYDAKDKDIYFIGSLIVNNQAKHEYSVVDGQQRLTTLYLLMAYLNKDLLRNRCLSFEARTESNNVLSALLSYDFAGDRDFIGDDSFNNEITTGIKCIQAFFRTKDDNFKKTVLSNLNKIILIRTQVPKNIDLNHYFEIMNTRGEQLELHEIAKGRILSKITSSYDKKIAAQIWEACSHMDEYIQMCLPSAVRPKIFGSDWNSFECTNFNDVIKKYRAVENEKTESENRPISNIDDEPEVKKYSLEGLIHDEKLKLLKEKKSPEENERFESIVSFPNFLLLINESLHLTEDDSSLDDKNFLRILEPIWKDEDENNANENCKDFIFQMLKMKYIFDKYVLKREFAKDYKTDGKWSLQRLERTTNNGQDKPKYVTTFFKIEEDEDNNSQNLLSLQSALRITFTSPKTMHWISYLLNYINELLKSDDITSDSILKFLETYACKKVSISDYKNKTGFEIERIVFTYLDYILYRDRKKEYKDFQFQFRNSIEHFHPQHPIEQDWDGTDEENEKYLNHFGNLVLITVKANSRFSNLSPNSKIDSYESTLQQSIKFQIMNDVRKQHGNKWTKEAVLKHGNEMIGLLDAELRNKLSLQTES